MFDTGFRCLILRLIPLLSLALIVHSPRANGQARVDLDDLSVKGELLNDNRLRMSARESMRFQDRVKYRKNFRPEIVDAIEYKIPKEETLADQDSGASLRLPANTEDVAP